MLNAEDITILYVEDEDGTRENLMYYLQNSFKKVFCASNGAEGLEIFKAEPLIDLVISDIHMPKMDGLMMIREVKKLNSKTPFLFTTAYNNQEYMLEAIELGAVSYIVKPVDIKILFEKIELAYTSMYEQKKLDIIVEKMSKLKSLNIEEFTAVLEQTLMEIDFSNIVPLYGNYKYNMKNSFISLDKKMIVLNHQEIKAMEYLLKNKNQIVPYEALMHHVSPEHPSIDILRTIIRSIRKKTHKKIIDNLSGVGYKLSITSNV